MILPPVLSSALHIFSSVKPPIPADAAEQALNVFFKVVSSGFARQAFKFWSPNVPPPTLKDKLLPEAVVKHRCYCYWLDGECWRDFPSVADVRSISGGLPATDLQHSARDLDLGRLPPRLAGSPPPRQRSSDLDGRLREAGAKGETSYVPAQGETDLGARLGNRHGACTISLRHRSPREARHWQSITFSALGALEADLVVHRSSSRTSLSTKLGASELSFRSSPSGTLLSCSASYEVSCTTSSRPQPILTLLCTRGSALSRASSKTNGLTDRHTPRSPSSSLGLPVRAS